MKEELKYWTAYFGKAVRTALESERTLKEDGLVSPFGSNASQDEIQRKLK